ncbi:MAG: hypothetical protein SFY70_01815 [Bacteroidia bacterium]|nr:hypothetical protein [Bacteroidia bacterium]
MRTLLLLTLVLLLSACVTQRACERRFPVEALTERVVVRDTVIVRPAARLDTVLRLSTDTLRVRDTVTLTRDRLRVELVRLGPDSLALSAECAPDTLRVPQVIRVTEVARLTWWQRNWRVPWGILAGFLISIIARLWAGR